MLARCFLTFTVLALMPLTGWSGPGFDPQSRDQSWRVLVEGDASVVPTMIEELRKSANEHNLILVTVAKASDTYDLRIIMTYREDKAWDNDPLRKIGEIRFPVSFAFSSIAVLSSDGRLLFTAAQSGNTRKTSVAAVAREAIKRMTDPGFTQHRSPKVTSKELSNQPERAKPSDISSSETEEQPGVYYKAADGLHRLEDTSVSIKTDGKATSLFTFGLAGIRVSEVYSKPRSVVQISERKPVFHIVGFGVSASDVRIIRLKEKKNHREIRTASLGAFDQKFGYRTEDIHDVNVVRVSDTVLAISPKSSLNPGEYLLDLTPYELRYDFGVSSIKN